MADHPPLYLGFDLSTQQLKAVAVDSALQVKHSSVFDFDRDAPEFGIKKGVLTNDAEREVFAPVSMWLRAIDVTIENLSKSGMDFSTVQGISGAGMQHGSVYWNQRGIDDLRLIEKDETLQEKLKHGFSWDVSPNWQDASTQKQCDDFDGLLGRGHLGEEALARVTGSKAHHRFTGPQILRFRQSHPEEYEKTARISLVSSFLASIFLGEVAPIDISDACGMNLWDVQSGDYSKELLALAAGSYGAEDLREKLGPIPESGSCSYGQVSQYFVQRYGFNPSCKIIPFTGDNPSTILALPLRPLDAIVSLGTSTTFLMSTPYYRPDPAVHFMNHPASKGLYMFMLCYKNGGLARENVRDALSPSPPTDDPWAAFNQKALSHAPLNAPDPTSDLAKLALYFPRPEIVPNAPAGTYRYVCNPRDSSLSMDSSPWSLPDDDARAILESQFLSLRLRSRGIVASPSPNPHNLPPQPRRIFLVGGGSQNPAIARLCGQVLGGAEGVYKLDVGGNACAMGSAYKAVWACERTGKPHSDGVPQAGVEQGETFEDFISARWRQEDFTERVDEGFQKDLYERYELGVHFLDEVEKDVLKRIKADSWKLSTTGAGHVA